MSHFVVYVIVPKDTQDIEADVERLLQPYHEFECTGTDDRYVQEIDVLEERLAEFTKETTRFYVDPHGNRFSPYEDRFYREPTPDERDKIGFGGTGWSDGFSFSSRQWKDGLGYRPKVHFMPEGWTEIEVPASSATDFVDWLRDYCGLKLIAFGDAPDKTDAHKYGWVELAADGSVARVIDRTNAHAKWDWWTVGGRWDGFISGERRKGLNPDMPAPLGRVSATRGGGAAFEARVMSAFGATAPTVAIPAEMSDNVELVETLLECLNQGEDRGAPFALVTPEPMNGTDPTAQWFERGRMGFWAVVHDEQSESAWTEQLRDLYMAFRGHVAVAVDCHI